jgi:hypothetical protein
VRVATNIHIVLQGKMPSISDTEQGATKKLHLKKVVKVNQLASCYESRHGYLAIGGRHVTVGNESILDPQIYFDGSEQP